MGLFLETKTNASLSELHDKPVKFDCGLTTPVIKLFQFKMHVIPFYNRNNVELEIQ